MNTKDAIRAAMDTSFMVFKGYLGDLDDADLMQRPGEGCNHLAWQVGHLTASEVSLLEGVCPGKAAELPAGFAEAHSKETVGSDDASKFCTKAQYLELMDKVREATKAALDELPEQELDAPSPEHLSQFLSHSWPRVRIDRHPSHDARWPICAGPTTTGQARFVLNQLRGISLPCWLDVKLTPHMYAAIVPIFDEDQRWQQL